MTSRAVVEVCEVVAPSNVEVATARIAYEAAVSDAVVQLHAPDVESATQVEPVSVHVPDDGLVPAGAVDSCTVEPTGAVPVSVSVVAFVKLSVDDVPESDPADRSGAVTSGIA